MISSPIIYAQNAAQIATQLTPPQRRLPKFLAWFTAILTPNQWLHDLVFNAYYSGSNAATWVSGTAYAYGARVKFTDYSIYECINVNGVTDTSPVNPQNDTANWMKVLDTFVGVGERVLYTGQKLMLEYILNNYFQVGTIASPWIAASTVNQIYITNIAPNAAFWLTNGSTEPLTSYMPNSSAFSHNFMGANPSYTPNSFTIYVPTAVDVSITANQVSGVTAQQVIRSIADKYVQAGKAYNYVTY